MLFNRRPKEYPQPKHGRNSKHTLFWRKRENSRIFTPFLWPGVFFHTFGGEQSKP